MLAAEKLLPALLGGTPHTARKEASVHEQRIACIHAACQ